MRTQIPILFTLIGSLLIGSSALAGESLRLGRTAEDFRLETLDGGSLQLSDALGKKATLIAFWAAWSPRSIAALTDFQDIYAEHGKEGLQVIGVNVEHEQWDSSLADQLSSVVAENDITYPVVVDTELSVYRTYEFASVPSFVLIDGAGKLVETMAGYPGSLRIEFRDKLLQTMGVLTSEPEASEDTSAAYVPKGKAGTYYQMGKLLFSKGKRDKGLRLMMQAVAEDPAFLEANQSLAEALTSLGRVEEAERVQDQVASLTSDS